MIWEGAPSEACDLDLVACMWRLLDVKLLDDLARLLMLLVSTDSLNLSLSFASFLEAND